MMFGGLRVDAAFARELMRVVEPMAIKAAQVAEQRTMERQAEHRRILELELQQARYDASLAERRYAACDPDNRLIAATLEKNWEAALRRVRDCEGRLDQAVASTPTPAMPDLRAIAADLEAAWKNTSVTMRCRQQLVRALVNEIVVDIDEPAREIVLIIHWKGGQHSELRLRKPRSGEHACSTSDDALAVIRSMATRWSDQDIAATLNRMGLPTGQNACPRSSPTIFCSSSAGRSRPHTDRHARGHRRIWKCGRPNLSRPIGSASASGQETRQRCATFGTGPDPRSRS
jgi:hypothetical protein